VRLRHDLKNIKKGLKALEAQRLQDGLILTEFQVVALEKAKAEKEPMEIRRAHPPGPIVLREDPTQTFIDSVPVAKEKMLAARDWRFNNN